MAQICISGSIFRFKNAISKNSEQSVVIAADKKVQYQEVVIVMDLLKQNEVNKVGLLLKPEK